LTSQTAVAALVSRGLCYGDDQSESGGQVVEEFENEQEGHPRQSPWADEPAAALALNGVCPEWADVDASDKAACGRWIERYG
jgi:hypothetical protein